MYVLIEALDQVGSVLSWAEFESQDCDFDPSDAFYCHEAWSYRVTRNVGGEVEAVEETKGPACRRAIAQEVTRHGH